MIPVWESEAMLNFLNTVLVYDPVVGSLTWKERNDNYFAHEGSKSRWNKLFAGTVLHPTSDGYVVVSIFKSKLKGHRVAWAMHHGSWPKSEIDHINRVRHDNRIENLRDVQRVFNCRNGPHNNNRPVMPGLMPRDKHGRAGVWRLFYLAPKRYYGRFACVGQAILKAREINAHVWEKHKET